MSYNVVKLFSEEHESKKDIIENLSIKEGFSFKQKIGQYGAYIGWVDETDTYIRLFQFQKFKKKSKQIQNIIGNKNVTSSLVIRKPYWKITYVDLPLHKVKTAIQFERDFLVELV